MIMGSAFYWGLNCSGFWIYITSNMCVIYLYIFLHLVVTTFGVICKLLVDWCTWCNMFCEVVGAMKISFEYFLGMRLIGNHVKLESIKKNVIIEELESNCYYPSLRSQLVVLISLNIHNIICWVKLTVMNFTYTVNKASTQDALDNVLNNVNIPVIV